MCLLRQITKWTLCYFAHLTDEIIGQGDVKFAHMLVSFCTDAT